MPRQPLNFLSESLPGIDTTDLCGKLIAFEGAVNPEQVGSISDWLMVQGFPVFVSNTPSRPAEFAEELELRIIPALRAGFVVLANRYAWSLIAQGGNSKRIEKVMGFALLPNLTCYVRSSESSLDKLAEKYTFAIFDADQPAEQLIRLIQLRISDELGLDRTLAIQGAPRRPSARRTRRS